MFHGDSKPGSQSSTHPTHRSHEEHSSLALKASSGDHAGLLCRTNHKGATSTLNYPEICTGAVTLGSVPALMLPPFIPQGVGELRHSSLPPWALQHEHLASSTTLMSLNGWLWVEQDKGFGIPQHLKGMSE